LEVTFVFRGFIQDLNLFRPDSSLLENIAFIFRNNHREFETMPIDFNLFVKYLKNSMVNHSKIYKILSYKNRKSNNVGYLLAKKSKLKIILFAII